MDLSTYLAGGAAGRTDSISGLTDPFQNALAQMFAAAPEGYLTINSGYRSPELQAQLYANALQRYGSEAEARRWVAPPGNSQHNHGNAVDLGFSGPEAIQWAHDNAAQYGLTFPLSNENWHIELAGARGGGSAASGQPTPASASASPASTTAPASGTQNALAGLMAPEADRRDQNRLAALVLDPAAFQARGQFTQPQIVAAPQQHTYATRYLGSR